MIISSERKALVKCLLRSYVSIVLMILIILVFSYAQGADWRPALVGIPTYATVFVGSTYQFIKDWRKLGRQERGEPEPPPWISPWERDCL